MSVLWNADYRCTHVFTVSGEIHFGSGCSICLVSRQWQLWHVDMSATDLPHWQCSRWTVSAAVSCLLHQGTGSVRYTIFNIVEMASFFVLALESWRKDSNAPSIRSPVVGEERTRLGSVYCVSFDHPLTLRLSERKDIWPVKKPIPVVHSGSLLEQMEEDLRGKQLTQVHLKKTAVKWWQW